MKDTDNGPSTETGVPVRQYLVALFIGEIGCMTAGILIGALIIR